jgi:endonuclease YncB( thermonuclease family)
VGAGSFQVKRAGADAYVQTKAYDNAYMLGEKKADGSFAQDKLINSKGQITVRLQRVDAPELHIKPGPIKGKSLKGKTLDGKPLFTDYRQRQAETGTNALRKFLKTMADKNGIVPCVFDTNLDASKGPGEAVDKYGRFVGDILVGKGKKQVNLNLWLLEQGWAIVALYDSMLADEIAASLKSWRKGKGSGAQPLYRSKFEPFELLYFREPGSAVQDEGKNKFIHPKYFRRYITWFAHRTGGNITGTYPDFLESKAEEVYALDEFVAALKAGKDKPANVYALYDRKADGDQVSWPPEKFIFFEAPSTVLTVKNGAEKKLTSEDW